MLIQPQHAQSNTTHQTEPSVSRFNLQAGVERHQTGRRLTTEQFASHLGLEAQSVRKRLCQTGSYYGIKPLKLPNGRLMWQASDLDQLMGDAGSV